MLPLRQTSQLRGQRCRRRRRSRRRRCQDDEALDIQPNPGPVDPEPSDFRQQSRDKDGGLSAEVVDALREQQADIRPTPGVRTPRT
jgi:hypothetical protein